MRLPASSDRPAYVDLDRPPLDARSLGAAVLRTRPWTELQVLQRVGSTNDVVATAARAGQPEGLVVVAEQQTAGRGRLDREWVSPPRAGLTMSMLFRPPVPASAWPWLPLLVAVAVARAAGERAKLDVRLKWPNDLLTRGRKVGGLLAESTGDAVVVGLGLNVSTRRSELPYDDATSLAVESGKAVDRGPLLLAILRSVGPAYVDWVADGGASELLAESYRTRCDTLGRTVRVALPGGEDLVGEALDVDAGGRLVVRPAGGADRTVSAGDVTHVRTLTEP